MGVNIVRQPDTFTPFINGVNMSFEREYFPLYELEFAGDGFDHCTDVHMMRFGVAFCHLMQRRKIGYNGPTDLQQ